MAVSLVGEVVNSCDATTGFNAGNISTDDDQVEGTGAIGLKISNTTAAMYTTTLGATAPYAFHSAGGEFGYHVILWFNTKTPVNATSGLRTVVGDGTNRGNWYVTPTGFYKGGFITAVVDTARDFDVITAGTWTTTGNPAQLSNVTQMGGAFTTTTAIMGSFNNCQLDQITIGLGVRADAGTVGTPNTFETVRAQDEDTSKWGWWSSKNGQIVGKGKLYLGPATGSATSVFTDTAFSVVFAKERVATGFYEIATRGTATDVTWTLGSISAADPATARWSLTVDSTTQTFSDTNGVWKGGDQLTLDSTSTLTGTALIDCTKLTQNGATLDGISVIDANTADGVAFILSDNPSNITNSTFTFSDGHAVRCDTTGTYNWISNSDSGYGGTRGTNSTPNSGSTDACFYNNSGGLITLNVSGAGGLQPSVRNGAGATTTVNASVTITVTPLATGSEVRAYQTGTSTEVDGVESSTGSSHALSLSSGQAVDIVVLGPVTGATQYTPVRIENVSFSVNQNLNPFQQVDRNFSNP